MNHSPIPFLWTNDDLNAGDYTDIEPMMALLDKHGIKGNFFVVPCQGARHLMTDDARFIEQLKAMQRAGHECHQHTVTHDCIENGTADLRMFDLMGDAAKVEYSEKRFVHERLWQVDALEAHIGWGRRVWTEAMGEPSKGYRPGCGAFCANMYTALENLGFEWCSARLSSMTGWMWAAGDYDYPLRLEGPVGAFQQGKLIEFPILDDVAFRIPREKINDLVELGWQLFQECVKRGVACLFVSHPFALRYEGGTGYQIHDKLLPRILESGLAIPMTLNEYSAKLKSGAFPLVQASPDYLGETIPEWHALSRQKI